MELLYKPDWPEAARRWQAWWDGELLDRPVICVTAPRAGATRREVPAPATLREQWWDIDYRLDLAQAAMEATFYGGEAFPSYFPNLGPDCFASWLGAPLEYRPTTSWARPIVESWADALPTLGLQPDSETWAWQLEATRRAGEVGRGKFMVGLADLHTGMDALAALRHPDRLCLDLLLEPEAIDAAMARLTPLFMDVYEALHQIIQETHEGSTTWLGCWSPGRYYPTSCDFAALIGPAHFDRWVLPDLRAQCEWLDHPLYHLDGPTAICHVPSLCGLENLRAIQWVQGAGGGRMSDWVELLQDIQRRGKGLELSVSASEIRGLLEVLDPRRVCFRTWCGTQAEAEDLLAAAVGWTRDALRRGAGKGA